MAKKIKEINTNTVDKKLVVTLTMKIRDERHAILEETKKEGSLFIVTKKFDSKYMTKYQYRQLLGLYDFMTSNPNVTEDQIRKLISKKPIEFGFLNKCVRDIEDFIPELKKHGASSMAEYIISRKDRLTWSKL